MRERDLCWDSVQRRLSILESSYRGLKTLRIFVEDYSESVKSVSLQKRNKTLKCTFVRTCDGDVVGRTGFVLRYVLACMVLNEKRKRIFDIADTARREGWERFFVTVFATDRRNVRNPSFAKPPPRSPIHVCLVFIVRSFYFSIIW